MRTQSRARIALTNLVQSVLIECIEASGKKNKEIAEMLGTTPAKLSDIIHGRRKVSVEMAFRLGALFGTTPDYWLNMQMDQELREVRSNIGAKIQKEIKPLKLASA